MGTGDQDQRRAAFLQQGKYSDCAFPAVSYWRGPTTCLAQNFAGCVEAKFRVASGWRDPGGRNCIDIRGWRVLRLDLPDPLGIRYADDCFGILSGRAGDRVSRPYESADSYRRAHDAQHAALWWLHRAFRDGADFYRRGGFGFQSRRADGDGRWAIDQNRALHRAVSELRSYREQQF